MGRVLRTVALVGLAAATVGCGARDARQVVTIWHQSRPNEREFLAAEIARWARVIKAAGVKVDG